METKRLTASDRDSLVRLNIAFEILVLEQEHLKARAALIPGAKRDMAMMAARIRKLMESFRDTVPPEQMSTYANAIDMSSYTVGVKKPGGNNRLKEYGMWLPFEVINTLLDGLHEKCMMCDLDTVGRKQCPLRKALTIIPNDVPERNDNDCPYYTVI